MLLWHSMMEMLTHNKCCHEQFIVVAVSSGTVLLSTVRRVSDDVRDTVARTSLRFMHGIYTYSYIGFFVKCVFVYVLLWVS
jgi:hypothetical protein